MIKLKERLKKVDYRHYICIVIAFVLIVFASVLFSSFSPRFIEAIRDFGLSFAFYLCEIFGINVEIALPVNEVSAVLPSITFPQTSERFLENASLYFEKIGSIENFTQYCFWLLKAFKIFAYVVLTVLPLILVAVIGFRLFLEKQNNDYNVDSKSVTFCRWWGEKVYSPVKTWWAEFKLFFKYNEQYGVICKTALACIFNIPVIVFEFLAFYLMFCVNFDFGSIFIQIYKLFCDLSPAFSSCPLWVWLIIGYFVFLRFRRKIGYMRLYHHEAKNCGFINERPLVVMLCGTMRSGKTSLATDFALSKQVIMRDKAFEKILENDLKFPYFPWINLENVIKALMEKHIVYNLATCRKFIYHLQHWFEIVQRKSWKRAKALRRMKNLYGEEVARYTNLCFDYDFEHYGFYCDDKLKLESVWEIIVKYAQLYFIYVIESALIISNYSIRVDDVLEDLGNFPLWNSDFFKRDSRLIDAYSRHSHIIDFDALRLGQLIAEDRTYADSFEFGVIDISEIGKERRNALELKEIKKDAKETNQKNDLFNDFLKMAGHASTVDNYTFLFIITDEQRPSSWGADARELCDIVHIKKRGDLKLAMPFFYLEDLLYDWIFSKFKDLYYQYRFTRGDNTLPMYLLKSFVSKFHGWYQGVYNVFGYSPVKVQVESGAAEGTLVDKTYYLSHKKTYSKRYRTDCFGDFFHKKALRSKVGLNDMPEYNSERATFEELKQQHSYFIKDLSKLEEIDKE